MALVTPVLFTACATKGFVRTQVATSRAATDSAIAAVTFAFDDATVRAEARPMLERFARIASKYYPNSTITVEGFADPAGTQSYNLALSRRRAESVRDALASLGLTGQAVRVVGYGESRLVHAGAAKDEPGAEQNRRVVFVIENAGPEGVVALAPEIR